MRDQALNQVYNRILCSILNLVCVALFGFVFLNIIVTTIFSNALPSQQYYLDSSQLRFLVLVGFGLIFLGYRLNTSLAHNTLKLSLEEKMVLFVSAYFGGLFLFPNFPLNFLFKNGLVLLFTPFLSSLLRKAIIFLINPDLGIFSTAVFDKAIPKKKRLQIGLYTVVLVFIVVFLSVISLSYLKKTNFIKSQFYITGIYPSKTTVAEDIVIEGYHFDWKANSKFKVLTDYGEVNVTGAWTDTSITLTLPLHLEPGVINLYLQKPVDGKPVKSNVAQFVVVPREEFFSTPQDEFMDKAIKKLKRIYYLEMWPLNRL